MYGASETERSRNVRDTVGGKRLDLALRHRELIKFSLVGGVTWVVDSVVFLALKSTVLEAKPVTAKVIAVLLAMMVSYVLNREWSFNARGGRPRHHEAALFFLISGLAIPFYSAPLWLSRYVLDLQVPAVDPLTQNIADFVAAQVVGVLLGMGFRFWALRRYAFPRSEARTRATGPRISPLESSRAPTVEGAVSPGVSVLIPTRNERDTVGTCIGRVASALHDVDHGFEVIVVDDSDDSTPVVLAELGTVSPFLRVFHRCGDERVGGLGGALMLGFASARGEVVVVMDSDLQHPPETVPALVEKLVEDGADICVASRYVPGGSAAGLDGRWRRVASLAARSVVHALIPATRGISDPCGGFFAVRRSVLQHADLQPDGFKILVEILARTSWSRFTEVPYRFHERAAGSSNFGAHEVARFARHMARLVRSERHQAPVGASDTTH